jgi:hypothetical protein
VTWLVPFDNSVELSRHDHGTRTAGFSLRIAALIEILISISVTLRAAEPGRLGVELA